MKQLIALTSHLKSLNLVPPECFDSWVEQAETPLLFDENTHGLECSRVPYTARIYLEAYTGSAPLLMAHVVCWLMEQDEKKDQEFTRSREDLAPPSYSITSNDEVINSFDVEIVIDFVEHIYLIEDINGGLEYDGKRWTIGDYDLWVAEQGDVRSIDPRIEAKP